MEKTAIKTVVPFHAVIVAAGHGSRAGGDLPKQYVNIGDRPVLAHTLAAFMGCAGLQKLVVVIDPTHRALFEDSARYAAPLPAGGLHFVTGGDSRKQSVFNGVGFIAQAADEDTDDQIILVHDAARPFITPAEIETLVATIADGASAATLAVPVSDTLRRSLDGKIAGQAIDRNELWAIQTPQGFRLNTLLHAHNSASADVEWTDDSGLASAAGYDVALVAGHRRNFKITTSDDLELADKILKGNK